MGFLNRTGAEIGYQLDKKCKTIIFYHWKNSKIPKVPSSGGNFWTYIAEPQTPNAQLCLWHRGKLTSLHKKNNKQYGMLKFWRRHLIICRLPEIPLLIVNVTINGAAVSKTTKRLFIWPKKLEYSYVPKLGTCDYYQFFLSWKIKNAIFCIFYKENLNWGSRLFQ